MACAVDKHMPFMLKGKVKRANPHWPGSRVRSLRWLFNQDDYTERTHVCREIY